MIIKKISKKKKAFSLIEMLVSLGVISIVMVIFFNALLISLTVTVRNSARSNIREEISTVASLITKDIRRVDRLNTDDCLGESCTMVVQFEEITWYKCGDSICKEQGGIVVYKTGEDVLINNFTFDQGFIDESTTLKNNVLVTIVASHTNEQLNINNVIRQVSTSTRNFER